MNLFKLLFPFLFMTIVENNGGSGKQAVKESKESEEEETHDDSGSKHDGESSENEDGENEEVDYKAKYEETEKKYKGVDLEKWSKVKDIDPDRYSTVNDLAELIDGNEDVANAIQTVLDDFKSGNLTKKEAKKELSDIQQVVARLDKIERGFNAINQERVKQEESKILDRFDRGFDSEVGALLKKEKDFQFVEGNENTLDEKAILKRDVEDEFLKNRKLTLDDLPGIVAKHFKRLVNYQRARSSQLVKKNPPESPDTSGGDKGRKPMDKNRLNKVTRHEQITEDLRELMAARKSTNI